MDLYFAHDSTLLPLVALLGLLDFGSGGESSTSEAARHCPFASRLVVELRASGAIALRYNGAVARTFPGGVTEWEAAYAAALAADVPGLCAADAA